MSATLQIVCPHCHTRNRMPAAKLGQGGQCGACKKPLFTGQPIDLSSAEFDTHVKHSDIPLLVDFWAPWCGPCKMMAPTFTAAASQLEPQLRLIKVNTEQEQMLAAQYQIRSIPTLVLFKQGREVARQAGALDQRTLLDWVRQQLA